MEQINSKLRLPSKEILSRFFVAYNPIWYVISTQYDQISVDKSITEIDATEVVNYYSTHINMFLGANCSNSNNLNFNAVKWLFLSGKQYKKENLKKLNIGFDFDNVPEINLSNNDFGQYNFVWNFGEFLFEIYRNVYSYVYPLFAHELKDALTEDEDEFDIYGVYSGATSEYVIKKMEEIMKPIMVKLIPNLKNTNLKILINLRNMGSNCLYEIIEDILKKGNFTGCYIKAENCNPEYIEKLGLSENDFKLYQSKLNASLKRNRVKN